MAVQDFVRFDVDEYRTKVQGYDDQQLQKKEVVLIRTEYSCKAGVISGVVMAPGTGGASLVGSALGGRAMVLVEQKLEVVRAELVRRGLPLHEKRTRDSAIPSATGGIAGAMGLCSGMEGHMFGTAAGAAANLVQVKTQPLERVHTAPMSSSSQSENGFQKLKRSLSERASSKTRSLQFSSEDNALCRQYDNLLERKSSIEDRYQQLREATLGAAGDKWYSYVVYHYPCLSVRLIIPIHADSYIHSLQRKRSLATS